MKDISVILPTYNAAEYLSKSIESVLNQTYRDFELIIVDDGSTDDTQKLLENYKDRIHYIYQKNGGSYKTRNTGILATDSTYIAFLDADDIWLPNKLEIQLEFMYSNPLLELVFSDADLFDDKGISHGSYWKLRGCYNEMMREYRCIQNAFSKLMEKNFILPSTLLLKRYCFSKVGLFDESFRNVGDKDMWLRMSMHFRIGCVPCPLVRRLIHSYSVKQVENINRSIILVVKKMEKLYPDYIEAKNINTKNILAPLYYKLGRCYFDQDKLAKARESFLSSIHNSFTLKSFIFFIISLLDIRTISFIRRIKNILLKSSKSRNAMNSSFTRLIHKLRV